MKAGLASRQQFFEYLASLLPLLTRELTEQAARKRTYVLRVLYALVLYGITFVILWEELRRWSGQSFAFMGRGRELFDTLATLQFFGLYLFLPAMTCGVLTSEKERDTLSLLMLTRLGGWSILIGKLFSRLIPMGSFILLSLPLVAVAYSLGGVEEGAILNLAWTLLMTALQIGSLAVACSAWFRTTAGAFLGTYLIGVALIGGPAFFTQGGQVDSTGILDAIQAFCQGIGMGGRTDFATDEVTYLLFGLWACSHPNSQGQEFWNIVLRTVPMGMFAVGCLVFARVMIWRRAFVQPSNWLLKVFRSLDSFFHRMNQNRVTRGIILIHENVALPLYEPIRWRETKKRSLGTTRYLIRLLLLLEVPVLIGILIPLGTFSDEFHVSVHGSAWFLWIIAALVIVIQSTGLIGAERSRQTLDVLLTTPLDSEQIVREKFAGIWRMIRMLWIPFATVYVFQFWWISYVEHESFAGFYGLRAVLAMLVYPPLIAWIGFHFSMRCRSQTQATLATLGLLTGIAVVPLIMAALLEGPDSVLHNAWFLWLSPIAVLTLSRWFDWGIRQNGYGYNQFETNLIPWLLGHFFLAGGLLGVLWYLGLRNFARYVNRNDGQIVDDDGIEQISELRQNLQMSNLFRRRNSDK